MRDSVTLLSLGPADYRRTPWRNGGGTTVDVAVETGAHGDVWRFGRTPIIRPGAFSDYSGFDRVQVLVSGRGLVLETPDGEIDVREPLRPVRFAGETPIVSRLEAGPVEVVNLIGDRARVGIDIQVLDAGRALRVGPGTHIIYNPGGEGTLDVDGSAHHLPADHALRLDGSGTAAMEARSGCFLLASIVRRGGTARP